MPGGWKKFLVNALMLENSYNGAWWYLFTYSVLVVISPVILKSVKRIHPIIVVGVGFAVYSMAYYVRFSVPTDSWLFIKFGTFGMTLFEYIIGAVCCKLKIFSWLYGIWSKIQKPIRLGLSAFVITALLYVRTRIVPSLFVAPASGFVLMTLFHFWDKPQIAKRIFLFIGSHSTNIWLTHMFFILCCLKILFLLPNTRS